MNGRVQNKVVINVTGQYGHSNNGGFNLSNFDESIFTVQSKEEILCDWQNSILGCTVKTLIRESKKTA